MNLSPENMCICGTPCLDMDDKIRCKQCRKHFHLGCLKSGRPSKLAGDVFFELYCSSCNNGEEKTERMKLNWVHVLAITLYNLQLNQQSKCGFFRWREDICNFIEKNWTSFFSCNRKKNVTWRGTIAGSLSTGCPQIFVSGAVTLKESGWWKLSKPRISDLFTPESLLSASKVNIKRNRASPSTQSLNEHNICSSRTRKKTQNSIQAAIELKQRKDRTQETKEIKKLKAMGSAPSSEPKLVFKLEKSTKGIEQTTAEQNIAAKPNFVQQETVVPETDVRSIAISIKQEPPENFSQLNNAASEINMNSLEAFIKQEPTELDLDVDVGCVDMNAIGSRSESYIEDIPEILNSPIFDDVAVNVEVKTEIADEFENDFELENEGLLSEPESKFIPKEKDTEWKSSQQILIEKAKHLSESIQTMGVYDEYQLIVKLKLAQKATDKHPEARRLRRKLLLRKMKHERNMPVFDLQNQVLQILRKHEEALQSLENIGRLSSTKIQEVRVLDRFQFVSSLKFASAKRTYSNFITRLTGMNDANLGSIVSPYTGRILKPFIRRDNESIPLRLKLLNEIVDHYHKRNNIETEPYRHSHPIDYSYVRPHHIPSINNLCRHFFWPCIDLSESLQYPDFSCVALYRKIVIGFAFMVPDVKFNEAYITFLFTHPDWRNAGIGTFMLYHLIQTCMGKDITLHVSARNPALLLYQKFGFKVEEFILDFYDKYLPVDSRDCRHAMFIRLNR